MKKNVMTMADVTAIVKKTAAYAIAYPETFRPGTESFAFYEKMSGICCTGLEHFTEMKDARPLLDILEVFAETGRPEAEAMYGAWLCKDEKPWYNPLIGKIMLMRAIDGVENAGENAPSVMLTYAVHILEGKGWFRKDEALARQWLVRSAELGCTDARTLVDAMDAYHARRR